MQIPLVCKLVWSDGSLTEHRCPMNLPCQEEAVEIKLSEGTAQAHMCNLTNLHQHRDGRQVGSAYTYI